jgi:hypothetical protein
MSEEKPMATPTGVERKTDDELAKDLRLAFDLVVAHANLLRIRGYEVEAILATDRAAAGNYKFRGSVTIKKEVRL